MAKEPGGMLKYEQARAMLATCSRVDEVKNIRDKAEALRVYGKQVKDEELERWAAEIKFRAMRRLGELSKVLEKGHGTGKQGKIKSPPSGLLKVATLKKAGLTKQAANRCERVAAIPAAAFEAKIAEKKSAGKPVYATEVLKEIERERKKAKREAARRAELEAREDADPVAGQPAWSILTGDCLELFAAGKYELGGKRPHLIFADPPYNIGIDYGNGHDDSLSEYEYLSWCADWIHRCHAALTPNGSLWLLVNHEYAAFLELILRGTVRMEFRADSPAEQMFEGLDGVALSVLTGFQQFHVRSWVTWYESFGVNCTDKFNRCSRRLFHCVKDPNDFTFNAEAVTRPSDRQTKYNDARANPGGKLLDDVWFDVPRLTGTAAERIPDFPTQLPLALVSRVVACATRPGDLVLDPFSGSGTTGAAALALGRPFAGFEKSKDFARIASLRLKGVTRG